MAPPDKPLPNKHATISAALAPVMAIGQPHMVHNPFSIQALRIDDSKSPTSEEPPSSQPQQDAKKSKRRSLGRSISPFRRRGRKSSISRLRVGKDETDDDSDAESTTSSIKSGITPRNNAFDVGEETDDEHLAPRSREGSIDGFDPDEDGQDDDEQDEEDEDIDPVLLDNTLYNAGCLDLHEHWNDDASGKGPGATSAPYEEYRDKDLEHDDEHITAPNVVLAEQQMRPHIQRRGSKMINLQISRPLFERNRCTITLIHGAYDQAAQNSKRPKRYIVASDGSEESSHAIEWTIGTVLRDGDETLIVSVMETDTKLDALDSAHENPHTRMEHQRTRQAMASVLARQATHLLERTRLEVKISCQAIHAKNSRHMLLDLIDFYAPTMVVVGSRGLGSLRGILLGSTSHYLVQKSSAPVMVARKRLKLPALPRGKGDVVQSVRARHMRLDQAAVEKTSNVADKEGKETADEDEKKDEEEEENEKSEKAADQTEPKEEKENDTASIKLRKLEALALHEKEAEAKREKERIKQEKKAAAAAAAAAEEEERGRAAEREQGTRGRSRSRNEA